MRIKIKNSNYITSLNDFYYAKDRLHIENLPGIPPSYVLSSSAPLINKGVRLRSGPSIHGSNHSMQPFYIYINRNGIIPLMDPLLSTLVIEIEK